MLAGRLRGLPKENVSRRLWLGGDASWRAATVQPGIRVERDVRTRDVEESHDRLHDGRVTRKIHIVNLG